MRPETQTVTEFHSSGDAFCGHCGKYIEGEAVLVARYGITACYHPGCTGERAERGRLGMYWVACGGCGREIGLMAMSEEPFCGDCHRAGWRMMPAMFDWQTIPGGCVG